MDRSVCLFGFISFALLGNSLSLIQREYNNCKNWVCDLRLTCIPENYTEGTTTSIYNEDFTQFSDNCDSLQPDASVNCENGEFIITVANVSQFNSRYNGSWLCFHKIMESITLNIPYFDRLNFDKEGKSCSSDCFLPEGEIIWFADRNTVPGIPHAESCEANTTLFNVRNTFKDDLFNQNIRCELHLPSADVIITSHTERYDEPGGLSTGAIIGISIASVGVAAAIVFGGMFIFRVGPFKK